MIQICIATHGRKRLRLALGGVVLKRTRENRPALPQSFELSSYAEKTGISIKAGSSFVTPAVSSKDIYEKQKDCFVKVNPRRDAPNFRKLINFHLNLWEYGSLPAAKLGSNFNDSRHYKGRLLVKSVVLQSPSVGVVELFGEEGCCASGVILTA
ncbi:hypothetical protein TNCV_2070251 [Trichonephila clavipes]|uniref:Uncharacterized protein n=1 Tax=Trichonephila clavipes TaxID=2585209 RepID=A0A8X7BD94_TRICX|nr:hypothetical protein TNCV_2070251 [Trichonephila clavipes]